MRRVSDKLVEKRSDARARWIQRGATGVDSGPAPQ